MAAEESIVKNIPFQIVFLNGSLLALVVVVLAVVVVVGGSGVVEGDCGGFA